MICAINSEQHAKHTEGFMEALRDRQVTYKCDPAPAIKRKLVLIISDRYTKAYGLAQDKGLLPTQWRFVDDPQKLKGLDPLLCDVWLARDFTKSFLYHQETRPLLFIRNFNVVDYSKFSHENY